MSRASPSSIPRARLLIAQDFSPSLALRRSKSQEPSLYTAPKFPAIQFPAIQAAGLCGIARARYNGACSTDALRLRPS
jgi:hypothetical protein